MAKPLDAEKCMAHARECVRLAGLTDDQEIRDQLIALAHDWIVAARKEEGEGEGEGEGGQTKNREFGDKFCAVAEGGMVAERREGGEGGGEGEEDDDDNKVLV